jgi:type IV secretion system protein VirB6
VQLIVDFVKYIAVLVLFCALTGCGGNSACIDADDFGFTTVTVSSRYNPSEIVGVEDAQLAPWLDYNLDLSGKVVLIMVKNWSYGEDLNNSKALSAWCPWWGTKSHSKILSPYCARLQECRYLHQNLTDHHALTNEHARCDSPVILNSPCLMKRGVGLYVDIERRGAPSPNDNNNVATMKVPNGVTLHLGAPLDGFQMFDFSGKGIMRQAGGVYYNYDGSNSISSSRLNYVHGRMYFKILDSYYDDNNGQYLVVIKSGLQEPGSDIFTIIQDLVQERLFGDGNAESPTLERNGVVRTIYQNIVTAPGYSTAIRASLILYISITSILFLMGSIQLTHTEIINRTIKVAIITALFNPSISWDFFNNYLFIWFYEGSGYIISILKSAAKTGPGDSNILTFLTTTQIMTKLISVLFATWQGWLYILIYFIMLVFLTIVLFDAAMLYMTAQVMIGLLICLAPIFIAFYLFEATKSFFENWLKQLIGYAVQCILVSAGILFMTMIIKNQIYNTLGFRVCLQGFPNMNFAGGGGLNNLLQGSSSGEAPVISLFSWWFPQIPGWHDDVKKAVIPIPKAHFKTTQDAAIGFDFKNGTTQPNIGDYCEAYECFGERYPDLPFLDPNNPYESRQMNILRSGDIVDFGGLFIIVVCIYLLNHFNSTLPSIAKFLSGTTGNAGDNAAAATLASSRLSAPIRALGNAIDKTSGFKGMREKVDGKIHNYWEKNVNSVASKLSNWQAKRLETEAISYGNNSAVAKLASNKSGISQRDASNFSNISNNSKYTNNLEDALKKYSPDSKILAKDLMAGLKKGNSDDFEKSLAKKLYNNDPEKLSMGERGVISDIMQDASVKEVLDAKKKEDLFKKAYLDAYTEMGKGPLSSRDLKKQERALKAERNVAWMDGLKSNLTGGILPSEADQMKYTDSRLRTFNEQTRDEEIALKAQYDKKELNALTIFNGRDIQRPEILANLRKASMDLNSDHTMDGMRHMDSIKARNNIDKIDAAIEKNLRNNFEQRIKSDNTIMGDTYIRTKMGDAEFKQMIDNLYAHANEMSVNDVYNRQESLYSNNSAAMEEIERRKSYINKAASDEVKRLYDIRNSQVEEKFNILGNAGNKIKKFVSGAEKSIKKKQSKDD